MYLPSSPTHLPRISPQYSSTLDSMNMLNPLPDAKLPPSALPVPYPNIGAMADVMKKMQLKVGDKQQLVPVLPIPDLDAIYTNIGGSCPVYTELLSVMAGNFKDQSLQLFKSGLEQMAKMLVDVRAISHPTSHISPSDLESDHLALIISL